MQYTDTLLQKLVALLHLQLPPEVLLTTARASVFRITFEFQLGVPHITVEIDGIQIRARLVDDANTVSKSRGTERTQPRARSPPADESSDIGSDGDEDHIPTVEDLAKSFIREEPEDELKELEHELESQSVHLQDSQSSDDDDDESLAGMGAPMALPQYLRNLLNTALDQLHVVVKNIDFEVQDQVQPATDMPEDQDAYTSLNFHVDRVAIDSVTAEEPQITMSACKTPRNATSNLGKRRLRIENICGRLISDASTFVSASRVSVPPSPVDTRSVSSSLKAHSEPAASEVGNNSGFLERSAEVASPTTVSVVQPDHETLSKSQLEAEPASTLTAESPRSQDYPLISSVHTTEDDRFADADSDDGLDRSIVSNTSSHLAPRDMSDSDLYDDHGLLDNAMFDSLLVSDRHDASTETQHAEDIPNLDGMGSSHEAEQSMFHDSQSSSLNLPTVSMLGQPVEAIDTSESASHPAASQQHSIEDGFDGSRSSIKDEALNPPLNPNPADSITSETSVHNTSVHEDLAESMVYSHEDAQSLYMSAFSAAPSQHGHIPGGWDSSSSASSHDTSSQASGEVPDEMIAGSILHPQTTIDDGCETPRPSSPQSTFSSPRQMHHASPATPENARTSRDGARRLSAKVFLSIDEITVWFPLGLDGGNMNESMVEASGMDFQPLGMAEDSIFETMPGSFSHHYASSSRKKSAVDDGARQRSDPRDPQSREKKTSSNVSIDVGTVLFDMDFSTGYIMTQMLTKATAAFTGTNEEPAKELTTQTEISKPDSRFNAEISVKTVSIAWRERLLIESFTEVYSPRVPSEQEPLDAIVKITMSSIYGANQKTATESQTKLQIGKFALSSVDQDIITFQSNRSKARRSIGHAPEQLKHDIELIYEQKQDRRLTFITRPVKVMFDLEKLDEALDPFGGFSGVLELSASISSNSRSNSPVMSPAPSRPRGVHFGDSPAPPAVAPSVMPKIQVQFGEVSFVLKGRSCAVQLQTTSVKVAVRGSNVRMKVADAQFTGPYTEDGQSGAPLSVKIQDTTVNFLSSPEEVDLDKLIDMITPSKDAYENDEDILIDTLLRQRTKGSVLRLDVMGVDVRMAGFNELQAFGALGAEMARLSRITKYLPDDDRPGILTLAHVQNVGVRATVNEHLGDVCVELIDTSIAHVGLPALFAAQLGSVSVWRDEETLIHEVVKLPEKDQLPMVMMRIIGDEMEPVVKAKLFNFCAEYHVTTVMAALGLSESGTADDLALGLASSVATVTGIIPPAPLSRQESVASVPAMPKPKPLRLDVLFRNCAIGLNPRKISAKGLFVLTDARFLGNQNSKTDYSVALELRKASLQAIDDIARLAQPPNTSLTSKLVGINPQLRELMSQGYITLSSIAAANVAVSITGDGDSQPQKVDVEFENELFVIESCADSTQTLIAILGGLQPPTPPSTAERYRPMVPLQQMMESFTMDALASDRDVAPEEDDTVTVDEDLEDFDDNADLVLDEVPTNMDFVGSLYNSGSLPTEEDMGDSMLEQDDLGALATPPLTRKLGEPALLESFEERYEVAPGQEELLFDDDYFKDSDSDQKGKARKWDSSNNRYQSSNEFKSPNAPLKVQVRNVNIIWNLFDGYDWPKTRNELAQVIDDIEARAEERRQQAQSEEELEFVEEGQLFNSVWIGVPIRDGKGALAKKVIHDINDRREGSDGASETGSYATSTATRSTTATVRPGSSISTKRLQKLGRGRHKRMAFELKNVAADLVVFEPGSGETVSSVDVRLQDLTVYDNIPSSTWNKFALCDIEPAKREMNRPMVNLAILTVKPAADLAATELVIEVSILPLRLHVDQFALEFIQRFFAFKDDSTSRDSAPSAPPEQPFIQRLDIKTVKLCLDYKPRKVDYRSIRSGSTSEFKNFMTLEGTPVLLRRAILYGVKSFDELHDTLSDIWTPDVIRNQLGQVLSGVAVARPIVNVGSAVAGLFTVSMREYKKDGRAVRAISKGMGAFARNTTTEAARLLAKTAIGAQNLLEGAEAFMNPGRPSSSRTQSHDWEDLAASEVEEPRATSNYADQPITVRAGLRSAARHFKKDWETARDAAIAIPGEIQAEGTGAGVAKVLYRRAPTVILRPLAGTTKAVSRTLMGVGNALDKDARRKIDDVSAWNVFLSVLTC